MILETKIFGDDLPVQPTGKIVMGKDVQEISEDMLLTYAKKISGDLSKHPSTMVQKSPKQLLEIMNQGKAILYLETETLNLLGFGQIWHFGTSDNSQEINEFGSWLSFKRGAGRIVLAAARVLNFKLFPESQLIALVEPENKRAQEIIERFVHVSCDWETSHLLEKGPTLMKKYDITRRLLV